MTDPQEAKAHTPGPWRVTDGAIRTVAKREQRMPFGIGGESTPNSVTLRRDDSKPPMTWMGDDPICEMSDDLPEAEQAANAAFIVRAANNFEALLEALEALLREAETLCRLERERTKDHGWFPTMEDHRIPQARDAIAKARE